MPYHGKNYIRNTGPKGEEIGKLGKECGHHCLLQTVGQAKQLITHCSCPECHNTR